MENEVGIVIPVFNEELVIKTFHERLYSVLDKLPLSWSVLYVNDGSKDQTLAILKDLQKNSPNTNILDLSKNHGQITAIKAGIDAIKTKAVIVIDADLEQPPELIPDMIKKWQEGYQIVNTVYEDVRPFSFEKIFGQFFYKLISWINPDIPVFANQFFLLGPDVVTAIKQDHDHNIFFRELIAAIGYEQVTINYDRKERLAGITKWGLWKKWNYALCAITGATTFPLKMPLYLGGFFIFISLLLLLFRQHTIGTLLVFLCGINFLFLGIMGEYLARVFLQSRNRPLYFVKKIYTAE